MDVLCDIVPGLRDAVERETKIRDEAFFRNAPEMICGIEVMPCLLDHFAILLAIKSPFLCGGDVTAEDVALFLWVVSPDYERAMRWRGWIDPFSSLLARLVFSRSRYRFVKRLRTLEKQTCVDAINRYVDDALMDAPKGSGGGPSYWSMIAGVVFLAADGKIGDEEAVMRMPCKRVFQYLKIARKRLDPDAALFNPSSELIGAWLAEKQKSEMEANAKAS